MKQFIFLFALVGLLASCSDPGFKSVTLDNVDIPADSTYEFVLKSTHRVNYQPIQIWTDCAERVGAASAQTVSDYDGATRLDFQSASTDPVIIFMCKQLTCDRYNTYAVYLPVVDTLGNVNMIERNMLVQEGLDIEKLVKTIYVDGKPIKLIPGTVTNQFQLEQGERKLLVKHKPGA